MKYTMTMKERAHYVAGVRNWKIVEDGNFNNNDRGWSFVIENAQGYRCYMSFNSRLNWIGDANGTGIYDDLDEANACFIEAARRGLPHFVCETNSDMTYCVIAKGSDFKLKDNGKPYINAYGREVRKLFGAKAQVQKVNNVD